MAAPMNHSGVLVGVDGSPASKYAVDWAARDAAMRNVRLTLVHAVRPIGLNLPPLPAPTAFARWQVEQGQKFLDDAVEIARRSTPDGGPGQIESELLFSPVVPTLVDLSKEAQMVVVGSRGRGPFARSLLGSVSSSLIRHAHCPVAVIHDEDPLMPHPAEAPVLVGIDGSSVSELATAIAFEEASMARRRAGRVARLERRRGERFPSHRLAGNETSRGGDHLPSAWPVGRSATPT